MNHGEILLACSSFWYLRALTLSFQRTLRSFRRWYLALQYAATAVVAANAAVAVAAVRDQSRRHELNVNR